MALDGETVDSGNATGILDGQNVARVDVIETRAEGWGSRRSTGSTVVELGAQAMKPEARAMDQDVQWLKIGTLTGKRRTKAAEWGLGWWPWRPPGLRR